MSVVNYTKTVLANKTVAAITFHSFGEVFFVPYAHNNSIPLNRKVNIFYSCKMQNSYHLNGGFSKVVKRDIVNFIQKKLSKLTG